MLKTTNIKEVLEEFEKQPFRKDDKVIIIKIEDVNDADHLTCYINKSGVIKSWIMNNLTEKVIKFKVRFDNGDTAYFLGSEIDKI